MEYLKTILAEKKQLAGDVWQFVFNMEEPKELNFIAGQYLMLALGEQKRSYSLASAESRKNSFELIIKLIPGGLASEYLRKLEIGNFAFFQGPMGGFVLKNTAKPKILLAAGVGIAPIRSQIISFLEKQEQTELALFWGLKTKKDVYFFEEFEELSKNRPNFNFWFCLDQEESFLGLNPDHFRRGRVDQGFDEFIKEKRLKENDLNDFEYYLCGGRENAESIKQFLEARKIKSEQIFLDRF